MSSLGNGTPTRTITAIVLISLTMSLIWIPALYPGFLIFLCLVTGCGLFEFYKFVQAKDPDYNAYSAAGMGIIIMGSAYSGSLVSLNALLVFTALLLTFNHIVRHDASMGTIIPSVFGLWYVGWNAGHFLLLYHIDRTGPALLTLLIVAVALCDTGAYFVGRSIGKHKLAPVVSPNKTWEGAVGGFLFSIIGMATVYYLSQHYNWSTVPDWSLGRYCVTGAILSVASQIGDLTESAFKRDAGVKDSGTILPGHGGVLDRCDGLLFAAPMLYYLTIL